MASIQRSNKNAYSDEEKVAKILFYLLVAFEMTTIYPSGLFTSIAFYPFIFYEKRKKNRKISIESKPHVQQYSVCTVKIK